MTNTEALIQCPFFKHEKRNLLCCEGFVDGTCMTTAFRSRDSALQYISDNCSRIDGGNCPMALNLFGKYQRLREAEEKAEREWTEKLMKANGILRINDNYLESRMTVN